MIVGTGTDIVEVDRVRRAIDRHAERFIDKIFTADEAEYCRDKASWAQHFAGRFAAKEAIAKALGTGFARGVRCTDVTITRDEAGRPGVELRGKALELAEALGIRAWHLTISHCDSHAVANAIAEGGNA